MSKKLQKAVIPNPWDRRPWPKRGNRSQAKLYAAVGRALSEWERYEAVLSFLFAAFVTTEHFLGARRAFVAIRTHEGRVEMLRAASAAYFSENPDAGLQSRFKVILKSSLLYAERRNEITHAAVDHFRPEPPRPPKAVASASYALFPSYASFRQREIDGTPNYCFTSAELEYFRGEFFKLRKPAAELSVEITALSRKLSSRYRFLSLHPPSANPKLPYNS